MIVKGSMAGFTKTVVRKDRSISRQPYMFGKKAIILTGWRCED